MAEIIGTTLGVVGFLGQLFDGCVKAYGYFTTASNLDTDSQRMMCKVRIEEMRLVVWGREWGVAEGKLEAHLDSERNPQLRALATQILEELHGTVTNFNKLRERYGLVDSEGVVVATPEKTKKKGEKDVGLAGAATWPKDAKTSNGKTNGERGWKKELSLRTRWVIQDKDKFSNLLRDLKDFNDGLERLFPPSQLPSFQRAWTHQLLETAQRDITQLSLLENASSGIYPKLHASANLKQLRINLDSKPPSAFKPTFALKVHRDAFEITTTSTTKTVNDSSTTNGRCHAVHNRVGDVVIEWVNYDREAIEERVAHVKRLDDLAKMMHSASSQHPDLHSIDCVGYTDDTANNRYGLIYNAPTATFSTLHALISSSDLKTPDLNDRIDLAKTLSVSLWSLHSLDWLHKSLCASNILFFPSAFSSSAQSTTAAAALVPDISSPFLAGFDASRPDLDIALSVAPRNPSIGQLHRHPASLRGEHPHCKSFDIYSFGLILLEIGLWKVLQTYHKASYSAEKWRDRVVLAVLVPLLGSKVGRRYKEVVEMCLRAGPELDSSQASTLMEKVVTTLEGIRL